MRQLFLVALLITFFLTTSAQGRSSLSSFTTLSPGPDDFPYGYTIASNESAAVPTDGIVGQGASFGDNVAVWRDAGSDTLALVDLQFYLLRLLQASNDSVTSIAGVRSQYGSNNGPRLSARFNEPCGVVNFNNQYIIVDRNNNCLRNISSVGPHFSNVGTFSGTCTSSFANNNFYRPTSIDVTDSYLYVADQLNDCVKRVDSSGRSTIVATLTDWKPTYITVLDDTTGFVISSDQELYKVNFVSGTITNTNFKNSTNSATTIQPSIDRETRTLFFVTQHLDSSSLLQSIVGLDIDTDEFTSYVTFAAGVADGKNPSFRDVQALFALSGYELLVVQKLSIRGLFVRPRPETATRTITNTPIELITFPLYFLGVGFPMTNATSMEALRLLLIEDLDECLASISYTINATAFSYYGNTTFSSVVTSNATFPFDLPMPRGKQLIDTCPYWRIKDYIRSNSGVDQFCAVDGDDIGDGTTDPNLSTNYCSAVTDVCDTRCKVATAVCSVGFAGAATTAGVMAMTATGQSLLVNALLILPGAL